MRELLDAVCVPSVWLEGVRVPRWAAINPRPGEDFLQFARVYHMVCTVQAGGVVYGRHHPESVTGRHHPEDVTGRHHPFHNGGHQPIETGRHHPAGRQIFMQELYDRMQRRMLGHLLRIIGKAQRFMGRWIYQEKGKLPARYQRLAAWVNDLMLPWVHGLAKIMDTRTMGKIGQWWAAEGAPSIAKAKAGKEVVYARLNTRTNDLYIGRTNNWDRRQREHLYLTFTHSSRCSNRCKGCAEHAKYSKHRRAEPHEWITVPIAVCAEYVDARRLEIMLYKRWGASLNTVERPFWLVKENYCQDIRKRHAGTRRPPWRRPERTEPYVPGTGTLLTQYSVEGEDQPRFDLRTVLQAYEGKEILIRVRPGYKDITRWREVRFLYGASYLKIQRQDGSRVTTTLGAWRPREETARVPCTVYIDVARSATHDLGAVLREVKDTQKDLERMTDEELCDAWRLRDSVDKDSRVKYRQMMFMECERRFEVRMRPVEVRLPYIKELDVRKAVHFVKQRIREQPLPEYLRQWHVKHLRVVTESQPSIETILCNVNQPTRFGKACVCDAVEEAIPGIRRTHGHVFFVGRDLARCGRTFGVCASNVPRQTWFDKFKAWERLNEQLPSEWRQQDSKAWKKALYASLTVREAYACVPCEDEVPDTKEVYQLKKRMRGLVIGPLDKNKGELWGCCPALYHQALEKMYGEQTGYQEIMPAKLSAYRRKRYTVEELPEQIMRTKQVPANQRGSERDLTELFSRIYKRRGWQRYAPFNRKGGLNQPYLLFKAKNVTEPDVRDAKLFKARPIAPGTRHPMRRLLHYVGRAWSFVTAQMVGEQFTINKSAEVPRFLEEAARALAPHGAIKAEIWDIEGCYPNMPKETIRFALRRVLQDMRRAYDEHGVYVPKFSDAQPCRWQTRRKGMQFIPFQVMLDAAEFSLDFAMVRMPDGRILRQVQGIPMGDPISPGMTIGTCGWMEREWMETVAPATKRYFRAKRFMDDILLVYAESPRFEATRFVGDLQRSECYQEPLRLEKGNDGTFLETRFRIDERRNAFTYYLKNDNEGGETRVWRYHHFHSCAPFMQRRATLTACLRKVQQMASDADTLRVSALAKIAEFRRLRYPVGLLRKACSYLAATTGERAWLDIRDSLRI